MKITFCNLKCVCGLKTCVIRKLLFGFRLRQKMRTDGLQLFRRGIWIWIFMRPVSFRKKGFEDFRVFSSDMFFILIGPNSGATGVRLEFFFHKKKERIYWQYIDIHVYLYLYLYLLLCLIGALYQKKGINNWYYWICWSSFGKPSSSWRSSSIWIN